MKTILACLLLGLLLVLSACTTGGTLVNHTNSNLKTQADRPGECVVLLHGLARTSRSMKKIQTAFTAAGYRTLNIRYPSTKLPIEEIVEDLIRPAIDKECSPSKYRLHFVGHSMGGIIARAYIAWHHPPTLGRVVMLGTPNHGSELSNVFRKYWVCHVLYGPSSAQLTTHIDSIPNTLPKVDYDVLVVAGTRSLNPFYSWLIPGKDDGKVSVDSARLEGASLLVVPYIHTFLMNKKQVIDASLQFLATGSYSEAP